jgi:hypothetical protein
LLLFGVGKNFTKREYLSYEIIFLYSQENGSFFVIFLGRLARLVQKDCKTNLARLGTPGAPSAKRLQNKFGAPGHA